VSQTSTNANANVRPPGGEGPNFSDTFQSELTKMRTLRSAFWSYLSAIIVVLGLCVLVTSLADNTIGTNGPDDFYNLIGGSWSLGQIAFMVLGILAITNEYSTSLISNTFLATPKRPRVLAAKVASFVAVTLLVAEVMAFANFFIGYSILKGRHWEPILGIGGPHVLRAVIGTGLYATLIGLMGLGLGTVLRHTAGSIVAGIALLLVLPGLAHTLPQNVWQSVLEYWPTEAGSQFVMLHKQSYALDPWWGLLVLVAFIIALLSLGGWLMNRRDA
jgi:hypothetical protein